MSFGILEPNNDGQIGSLRSAMTSTSAATPWACNPQHMVAMLRRSCAGAKRWEGGRRINGPPYPLHFMCAMDQTWALGWGGVGLPVPVVRGNMV